MKEINITATFTIFDHIDELPSEVRELMQVAVDARKNAYAPYSKFRVGAALKLANNEVVIGSNQENAAYPSGLCAERVAIFQAGAAYPNETIKMIAISAASDTSDTNSPIPPCGGCRQAIAEYEFRQNEAIEIYFMGASGSIFKSNSLRDLLPVSFDKNFL